MEKVHLPVTFSKIQQDINIYISLQCLYGAGRTWYLINLGILLEYAWISTFMWFNLLWTGYRGRIWWRRLVSYSGEGYKCLNCQFNFEIFQLIDWWLLIIIKLWYSLLIIHCGEHNLSIQIKCALSTGLSLWFQDGWITHHPGLSEGNIDVFGLIKLWLVVSLL